MVHDPHSIHGGQSAHSREAGTQADTRFRRSGPANDPFSRKDRCSALCPAGGETILLVDDDEALLEICSDMLERLGYKVVCRASGTAALEAFRTQPDKYDLVITDQVMPGMAGMELAMSLLRIRPGLPIFLWTGSSVSATPEKARAAGIRELLLKPVVMKDLARLVRNTLDEKRRERLRLPADDCRLSLAGSRC